MELNFFSQGVACDAQKFGGLAKVTLAAVERIGNKGALHGKGHHLVDGMWLLVAKLLKVAVKRRG